MSRTFEEGNQCTGRENAEGVGCCRGYGGWVGGCIGLCESVRACARGTQGPYAKMRAGVAMAPPPPPHTPYSKDDATLTDSCHQTHSDAALVCAGVW
jgi:hypothetical protein